MTRLSASRGFTLVEIMIAVVIGLFLTAGMIQMYVANRQTYRFNEALARIQENGRYALDLMAADIRAADFWGCSRRETVTNHLKKTPAPPYVENLHGFVSGLDGADSSSGTAGDPDEITLRGAVGRGFIVQGHGSQSDPIAISGSRTSAEKSICGYDDCLDNSVADIVLVSNCRGGDIFQVTSLATSETISGATNVDFSDPGATGTPGNDGTSLSNVYDETGTLYVLRAATYCVSRNGNCTNPGTSGQRGLYLVENGDAEEIVEGVENMQITYGEDTDDDGNANRYVPFTNLTDIDNVVSVRVALLLTSAEDGLTSDTAQTFDLNGDGDTSDPEDTACPAGHICQLMSSTVTLRNRIH